MQRLPLQQCTIEGLAPDTDHVSSGLVRSVVNKRWYVVALASAVFAVGAVAAQPRVERAAMATMPHLRAASLSDTGSLSDRIATDATTVRSAIDSANARWLNAFRTGDSSGLASIYAPDASLFPPSNAGLEGRERIVDYFNAQRSAGMGEATLKTIDVVTVGDVAYETGMYGFRFDDGTFTTVGDTGRYFAIWKSQPDGSWRYQVGIWSSNRDLAAKR